MDTPAFVDAALGLRRSHAKVPALGVLDLVMQGHSTESMLATAPWLDPSHPFAGVVCAAFDPVMTIDEWHVMTSPRQERREALLEVWRNQVVHRFLSRYSSAAVGDGAGVPPRTSPSKPTFLHHRL